MVAREAENATLIDRFIAYGEQGAGSLADARLRDDAIPVWALIGHLHAVDGDAQRVAHNYDIPVDAIRAAIAFYECHRDVIDDRIRANDIDLA